jgi:hypothetical protein
LGWFDGYKYFNHEPVPELLEKRKKEQEKFIKRETERKNKLKEAERKGKIILKSEDLN